MASGLGATNLDGEDLGAQSSPLPFHQSKLYSLRGTGKPQCKDQWMARGLSHLGYRPPLCRVCSPNLALEKHPSD